MSKPCSHSYVDADIVCSWIFMACDYSPKETAPIMIALTCFLFVFPLFILHAYHGFPSFLSFQSLSHTSSLFSLSIPPPLLFRKV